jgi:hypothetical protein
MAEAIQIILTKNREIRGKEFLKGTVLALGEVSNKEVNAKDVDKALKLGDAEVLAATTEKTEVKKTESSPKKSTKK